MSYDIRYYNLFLDIDWYPFYFPVADVNGKVTKGHVLRPLQYFKDRGLDPRPYYERLTGRR